MAIEENHKNRCSGISGRTVGKMYRTKTSPSSQHNGLRQKTALRPMGKNRYPLGYKYTTQDGKPVPGC